MKKRKNSVMLRKSTEDFHEVINSYHLLNYSAQNNGPSKILLIPGICESVGLHSRKMIIDGVKVAYHLDPK